MMKAKPKKVPVSARALLQRVNRKLDADGEIVKRTRDGSRARVDMGEYFVVDTAVGGARATNIDLESYARELGVMADWEALDEEG
jgi:hypothetical protein